MILYPAQHPLSATRFDPISIISLVAAGAAGFGAAELFGGMNDSPKPPSAPALPDPTKAGQDAQTTVNNQRRLALLTGGLTDFTGGQASIADKDINKQLLLGG